MRAEVLDKCGAVPCGGASVVPGLPVRQRAVLAAQMLERCEMCEFRCAVDRLNGQTGPCHLGADSYCLKSYVSHGDEPDLVPALRVYLGGCNFRCRFCNTAPDAFEGRKGRQIDPELSARECEAALDAGVRSIYLLGGEPSLHAHTILNIAAASRRRLPFVLNTNGYMTPRVLDLLDGVIDLYLFDFKFGNDDCAQRLAGVRHYLETISRNVSLLHQRAALRVRHLLMPGHLECCFRPAVDWLSEHLPGSRFKLMTGYVPCWRAGEDPAIGRLNRRDEVQEARAYLRRTRLDWRVDGDDEPSTD